MDLKLKKKPFKEFIKNVYKKKLIKNILAALCEQKGYKVHR